MIGILLFSIVNCPFSIINCGLPHYFTISKRMPNHSTKYSFEIADFQQYPAEILAKYRQSSGEIQTY